MHQIATFIDDSVDVSAFVAAFLGTIVRRQMSCDKQFGRLVNSSVAAINCFC